MELLTWVLINLAENWDMTALEAIIKYRAFIACTSQGQTQRRWHVPEGAQQLNWGCFVALNVSIQVQSDNVSPSQKVLQAVAQIDARAGASAVLPQAKGRLWLLCSFAPRRCHFRLCWHLNLCTAQHPSTSSSFHPAGQCHYPGQQGN